MDLDPQWQMIRADGWSESDVRQHLGAARLRRERVLLPVAALSEGEKMRAAIVKLILERCEFLVLDEPTSHLDLESVEVLLEEFCGGLLLVSHDRRLVGRICDELVEIVDGRLRLV